MKNSATINYLSFILCAFLPFGLIAQQAETVKTIQPSVMVVPFTKPDQNIRGELANNKLARLAISKVKEAFDKKNFPTVDASAKLKMISNDRVMEIENAQSIKQQLIETSGADIYVDVESSVNRSASGNSVTVILSAYDAVTGSSLANKSGVSPRFYTESFEQLVDKAVDEITDEFMQLIQNSFDDIHARGRMVAMNIGFSADSELDMDFEFEDLDLLSDKIESWLEENAHDSYFHIQGVTATKMIIDELRIPLKTDRGTNYRVSKFVQKFRKYLRSLGLDSSRDLQGGKIFITIL